MKEPHQDVLERLARLEAQVADLLQRESLREAQQARRSVPPPVPETLTTAPPKRIEAQAAPLPPPQPAHVSATLPPPGSAKPMNPIVIVAAIGSGIFLLGTVFFLHLAIQRGWIGPEMRFALGVLVGLGLTGGAAKMILGQSQKVGSCLLFAGLGTLMFTLRWGSVGLAFIPVTVGLAGTAFSAAFAGGLAARTRFEPPLWAALLAGFINPMIFSQGGHHEAALASYLALLMAAALSVPYLARVGEQWTFTRWFAWSGTWIMLAAACFSCQKETALILMALLIAHHVLAGFWIWLPGAFRERPTSPTLLWFLCSLAMTSLWWALWNKLHWTREWFAFPVILLAGLNLLMVKPIRVRLESRKADLGLLVLAAGHLAIAVPIALNWKWVGPMWGLFALGLAWAVEYAEKHPDWEEEEARAILFLAIGMVLVASLHWAPHAVFPRILSEWPFLNRVFMEGILLAASWAMLLRRPSLAVVGWIGLQVAGNVTLALELSRLVHLSGGGSRAVSIAFTLVYALSGATQWLYSLSVQDKFLRRALAMAGYVWLGIASIKLTFFDMERADMVLRALAFLGVGGIFLAAALVANRARIKRKEGE